MKDKSHHKLLHIHVRIPIFCCIFHYRAIYNKELHNLIHIFLDVHITINILSHIGYKVLNSFYHMACVMYVHMILYKSSYTVDMHLFHDNDFYTRVHNLLHLCLHFRVLFVRFSLILFCLNLAMPKILDIWNIHSNTCDYIPKFFHIFLYIEYSQRVHSTRKKYHKIKY